MDTLEYIHVLSHTHRWLLCTEYAIRLAIRATLYIFLGDRSGVTFRGHPVGGVDYFILHEGESGVAQVQLGRHILVNLMQ